MLVGKPAERRQFGETNANTPSPGGSTKLMEVLFSYSHVDEDLRNKLEIHLAMLKRDGLITAWHDRRITAGKRIDPEISEHLESAGIFLLLASPEFLASDYCVEIEMRRALERHEAGEARVIPVILRPCDWLNSPLKALRATPRDGKPIVKHANVDDAFLEVAQDIRAAIGELRTDQPIPVPAFPVSSGPRDAVPVISEKRSSNLRVKRTFNDHERDRFLEESFEYIANYIENSLAELKARNPQVDTRFRRIDANHFSAAIYLNGRKASGCRLWLGGDFGRNSILYSGSDEGHDNSWNEQVSAVDDGFNLALSSIGGLSLGRGREREAALTQEGAAEIFWAELLDRLQR